MLYILRPVEAAAAAAIVVEYKSHRNYLQLDAAAIVHSLWAEARVFGGSQRGYSFRNDATVCCVQRPQHLKSGQSDHYTTVRRKSPAAKN